MCNDAIFRFSSAAWTEDQEGFDAIFRDASIETNTQINNELEISMRRLDRTIDRFKLRIESVLRTKGSLSFFSIGTLLLVLSKWYGGVMALRARLYKKAILPSKRLPCCVVSIGNLVAGGTGKTPMTIFLAQLIREMGYRVVVISRGYGGKLEKKVGIVSDGETVVTTSTDAGDEPYLMAKSLKGVPVVVGSRRYEAGRLAVKHFRPDVIVLDDAFQHLRLKRDLNLVLLDYDVPFGNGHMLPRGTLREPLSALNRADAVVFTRSHGRQVATRYGRLPASLSTFYTEHKPVMRMVDRENGTFVKKAKDINFLKGKKALAFAGLANNNQFFASLSEIGCELIQTISFSDHYRYGFADLDTIVETARSCGVDVLITTLKDAVKFKPDYSWPIALVVMDVEIHFIGGLRPFLSTIETSIKNGRKN